MTYLKTTKIDEVHALQKDDFFLENDFFGVLAMFCEKEGILTNR